MWLELNILAVMHGQNLGIQGGPNSVFLGMAPRALSLNGPVAGPGFPGADYKSHSQVHASKTG